MAFADPNSSRLEFLQKDYEIKVDYLTQHFSRMWTRFNFFLVLETAVSGVLIGLYITASCFSASVWFILAIGMVSSLCWYVFGAEDRYLVEVYRGHVRDAGLAIARTLGLPGYVPVGDESVKIKQHVYQWRYEGLSTTRLAAWFPLLTCFYWGAMLALTKTLSMRCP